MPPVSPMLAKLARTLPTGEGLVYEPKWDGFRCIVFRDGDELELGSRNERPLTRYFPELADPIRAHMPSRCVVDGEIVIASDRGLDFEALLQRIHPADSRVRLLAAQTPASFVAFDLLALGDDDVRARPFVERRALLSGALADVRPPVHLTPATDDPAVAAQWFDRFEGAGLDGVVAKRVDLAYRENERVMLKVKHQRTADCVVAGFRWHKSGGVVGSLLLGLYDDSGVLHHVGVAAAFTMARRRELVDELAPLRPDALDGHPWAEWASAANAPDDAGPASEDTAPSERDAGPERPSERDAGPERPSERDAGSGRMPGAQSRWNAKRDLSWEPLRPELVAEVSFDHLQGDRFRHATHFQRWRPDRRPETCTYAQLDVVVPEELAHVFGA